MLDILSWNIRQGGGNRTAEILRRLVVEAPEIIILSEFRNNGHGIHIRSELLRSGYIFQGITPSKSQENTVLVASKVHFNQKYHPKSDANYSTNILEVEFSAFSIFAVYMPHKKKHQLFNFIKNHILSKPHPYMIIGDFNSGINGIDQKGQSFWYEKELKDLQKQGMADAFRHCNGDVEEYSWFSHQGNGYRYDHTYVDEHLLPIVKDCLYLHDWRKEGLSDHSPMLLKLGQ